MFSNYYVNRDNAYRRLSPVTKLILPLAFVTICFFVNSPWYNVWLIPLALFLLRLARVPGKVVQSFVRVLYTLIPFITISWLLLFKEGHDIFKLGIITITNLGLERALAMDFRFTAVVLSVPLILGTMPQQDMIAAMRKLHIPYAICFIFTMALRFIPTLMSDYEQIGQAQMSRGLELEKVNAVARVKNLVATILPMLALSIFRLETISRVVECRGLMLGSRRIRTFYKNPILTPVDYALIATAIVLTTVVGILRYRFGYFVIV
jgi:energy-coupling factor transport system permease protein